MSISEKTDRRNILIVVVLYNQDLFCCETYISLLRGSDCDVFVYDNSPVCLTELERIPVNWKYLHDPKNPGLGKAYNDAARYAASINKKWILIADQDTSFPEDIIDGYLDVVKENEDFSLFSPVVISKDKVISPVSIFRRQPSCTEAYGRKPLSEYFPINSGSLIRLETFFNVGGYNEDVFLDYSDYEFSRRLLCKEPVFFVIKAVCRQNFSNDEENIENKLSRFRLFCRSIRKCSQKGLKDKLYIDFIVLKRTLSLSIRAKTFSPFEIFLKDYL